MRKSWLYEYFKGLVTAAVYFKLEKISETRINQKPSKRID